MKILRIGIVGTGSMAAYHAARFRKLEGIRIEAVCDHEEAHARAFAASNGIPLVFPDCASMAASGAVDAVTVASVDGHHGEAVLAALSVPLPVFCEKPLSRSLAEAAAMKEAADSSGVAAIVNFSKRNMPALGRAAAFISSGGLGEIRDARLGYLQSWLTEDSWGDFRTTPKLRWRLSEADSTFGVIGDLGSHLFDCANFLLGPVIPASLRILEAIRFVPRPEDAGFFQGRGSLESFSASGSTEGGAEVGFAASFRSPGHLDDLTIELSGSLLKLRIDTKLSRETFFLRKAGEEGWTEASDSSPRPESTYEIFAALARGEKRENLGGIPDFGAGLAVQKIIASCAAGLAV
jgi:predicted dehydrogenase